MLRVSEVDLRGLAELLPIPTVVTNRSGAVQSVNATGLFVLMASAQSVAGYRWLGLLDSASSEAAKQLLRESTAESGAILLVTKPEFGGTPFECQFSQTPSGEFVVTATNISGYHWQEEQLTANREFLEKIIALNPAVHLLVDLPSFGMSWVSENTVAAFGITVPEIKAMGSHIWEMVTCDPVPFRPRYEDVAEFQFGERFVTEFTSQDDNGNLRWYSCTGEVYEVANHKPTKLLISLEDISSQKEFEAQVSEYMLQAAEQNRALEAAKGELEQANMRLEELTLTDPLTGLANRRAFDTAIAQCIQVARRYQRNLSILSLDLDHFKKINDTFGHGVGDEVLVATGQALAGLYRETDHVARIGGEEFIVLLPETSVPEAQIIAERTRRAIEAMTTSAGKVTASIGLTYWRNDETAVSLVHRVDEALYESKASGRNRVSLAA